MRYMKIAHNLAATTTNLFNAKTVRLTFGLLVFVERIFFFQMIE